MRDHRTVVHETQRVIKGDGEVKAFAFGEVSPTLQAKFDIHPRPHTGESGRIQERLCDVDSDDIKAPSCQGYRVPSGPATNVEDPGRCRHTGQSKDSVALAFGCGAVRKADPIGEGALGFLVRPVPLDPSSFHRRSSGLTCFRFTIQAKLD